MKHLNFIKNDPWLEPYKEIIESRRRKFLEKEAEILQNKKISLPDFASGYLYFGLHQNADGWIFREWAPNAESIYIKGDFNGWNDSEDYKLTKINNGVFEIKLPQETLKHGDLYRLKVRWENGSGERIPAWATRVVQDSETLIFNAQVWKPENPYQFKIPHIKPNRSPLLIYECHIGMAGEEEKVGSYKDFTKNVLPRIKDGGYNCIQMMAVQEHPYYASFGYHVSGFFAASSRFGTPDELKELIDKAHSLGVAVIMDLVHSHAVKNTVEGLGLFDGSEDQYFHTGTRREHPAWDSLCFNYGKNEVLHFLLSNCKFWLEEYHFDGYRFDGVTSMIYYSHGLGENFTSYNNYFDGSQDVDAISYLTLANRLIHEINRDAVTIAEEVSGMPGLAVPIKDGGYGFDYRMAMNIPDYFVKIISETRDENWSATEILWETTNRRKDEKTVSYLESHDQALVGGKTILFMMTDAEIYQNMSLTDRNITIDRAIALHKILRLATASTINGAYLNFMGNEFGHPEWIDFPREGNNFSYKYARRQWSLVDNINLKYRYLGDFDREMIRLIGSIHDFQKFPIEIIHSNDADKVLAFRRNNIIFVFNYNPVRSFTGYGFYVTEGKYIIILNTDSPQFGGFGLIDENIEYNTKNKSPNGNEKKEWLKLYLPARTAIVLKMESV
ncbi:MAG: alpha amylase C-terminal domain-containing protein [Dysgonamonadaceae bacterium]|jgi:1,4-alpha-glucan branching enzyme|nr:alpha amylase C-terminal domain-containing protein [Dysgonamonadaceae bacterium]